MSERLAPGTLKTPGFSSRCPPGRKCLKWRARQDLNPRPLDCRPAPGLSPAEALPTPAFEIAAFPLRGPRTFRQVSADVRGQFADTAGGPRLHASSAVRTHQHGFESPRGYTRIPPAPLPGGLARGLKRFSSLRPPSPRRGGLGRVERTAAREAASARSLSGSSCEADPSKDAKTCLNSSAHRGEPA